MIRIFATLRTCAARILVIGVAMALWLSSIAAAAEVEDLTKSGTHEIRDPGSPVPDVHGGWELVPTIFGFGIVALIVLGTIAYMRSRS